MRETIRFIQNGEIVSLSNIDPNRTVLQYLREDRQLTGTKEGCAEGDCGACTVVVAELDGAGERVSYHATNSCIQFLPTLDGKELITVESIASGGGELHPTQRAMVACHASQCGFCTPGFVMSLYALYNTQDCPTRREIDNALAGNLCRCTGYRPIVDAAIAMYDYPVGPHQDDERARLLALRTLKSESPLQVKCGVRSFSAPTSLEEFAQLYKSIPDAFILAGGTDLGLWVTKQHRELKHIVYLGKVSELRRIHIGDEFIDIGAAVTLTDAIPAIVAHYPDLEELLLRFASPPIRNVGTLGGNIANGSPIGDSMPALIAIGAVIVLNCGGRTRSVSLDEYYLDYQKTVLQEGEFVERILLPLPEPNTSVRSYKLSKRFDQDISAVCAAFTLQLDGNRVSRIRTGFGGVAAIPKRAEKCERALQGQVWDEAAVRNAMQVLDQEFRPISDMRASREYRRLAIGNLLYRFFLETTDKTAETSVYDFGR